MHILHYSPTQSITPVQLQILEMASFQKAQGHTVSMVTFPKSSFELLCQQRGLGILSFNVERAAEHFKFWTALQKLVGEKKLDVFHLHSTEDLPRFQQIKQLQNASGNHELKTVLQIHFIPLQMRKDTWQWISTSGISEVWCASLYMKNTLQEFLPVPANQVSLVPYGRNIDAEKNLLSRQITREQMGLPNDAVVFGSLSPFEKVSGTEEAVRAFTEVAAKQSQLQYIQWGAINENVSDNVNFATFIGEWISFLKADVKNRIHFQPPKPDSYRWLKTCDLYLHCHTQDIFPFQIMDAFLSELPVIAANTAVVAEFVSEGETGFLFEPGNIHSLVEAIGRALAKKDQWSSLGKAGSEKLRSTYNQKLIFENILKKYQSGA